MTITMHHPQEVLLREIKTKDITQQSVALTYAFIIAQEGDRADWPKINAAIRARWKGKCALGRVKTLAWKQVDEWRSAPVKFTGEKA